MVCVNTHAYSLLTRLEDAPGRPGPSHGAALRAKFLPKLIRAADDTTPPAHQP